MCRKRRSTFISLTAVAVYSQKQKQRLVSKLPDRCFRFDFSWLVTLNILFVCPPGICYTILFLTVSKNKIAATPENIGVVAILTVVLNYSILFPSFTFVLDGFHLAFGDKFEICIKTTDLM